MKHLPLLSSLILLSIVLSSCISGFSPREEQCDVYEKTSSDKKMLAIGDSVFAWRLDSCETVPDVAATTLGWTLRHKAVNGARLTGGDYPIVEQYEKGTWDWVVVDGGGNDLNNECECGKDCGGVLDRLVSEDGSAGELPDLLDKIRADGPKVALYGYFKIDEDAYYDFDECRGELDILHTRQAKAASLREGVFFVDARQVVSPSKTPDAYAFDNVHPSAEGAKKVGKLIAKVIREAEASEAAVDTTVAPPQR